MNITIYINGAPVETNYEHVNYDRIITLAELSLGRPHAVLFRPSVRDTSAVDKLAGRRMVKAFDGMRFVIGAPHTDTVLIKLLRSQPIN